MVADQSERNSSNLTAFDKLTNSEEINESSLKSINIDDIPFLMNEMEDLNNTYTIEIFPEIGDIES